MLENYLGASIYHRAYVAVTWGEASLSHAVHPVAGALNKLMGSGQHSPLLCDDLGSFLKAELHWVTPVFVCEETITFAPKPSAFTWRRRETTTVAEGRSFWFASRGHCCGLCILC